MRLVRVDRERAALALHGQVLPDRLELAPGVLVAGLAGRPLALHHRERRREHARRAHLGRERQAREAQVVLLEGGARPEAAEAQRAGALGAVVGVGGAIGCAPLLLLQVGREAALAQLAAGLRLRAFVFVRVARQLATEAQGKERGSVEVRSPPTGLHAPQREEGRQAAHPLLGREFQADVQRAARRALVLKDKRLRLMLLL